MEQLNSPEIRPLHPPPATAEPLAATGPGPAEPPRAGIGVVGILLILICLMLGVLAGWATRERNMRAQLAAELDGVHRQQALLLAGRAELAELMALPGSELIHLFGHGPREEAQAAIVWDPRRQMGVIIARQLPPLNHARRYVLWLVDDELATVQAAILEPTAGVTIHSFATAVKLSPPAQFQITAEPPEQPDADPPHGPRGPVLMTQREE